MQSTFKKSLILEIPAASVLLAIKFWSLSFIFHPDQNASDQYIKDPYNLQKTLNKIIAFIREAMKETDLSLDYNIQETLTETISNAYDAHVKQARLGDPLTLKVVVKTESDKLLINIMDTGSGFLKQPKSVSFQVKDIPETEKDKNAFIGGMGIGLRNLNKAVTAAHGSLFFKNRKDQGATVSVQLPLKDPVSKRLEK